MRYFCVTLQIGHQKHIAKAVIQFYFRHCEVVGVHAKVSGEESLNVTFALNAAAYGSILLISLGYEFYQVDILVFLIFFQDIFIILFTDIRVGNSQDSQISTCSDDS